MADNGEGEEQSLPSGPDISGYLNDVLHSCYLQSPIPDQCLQEDCCMGIDEAGRGPVLGPMVYGTAFCPLSRVEEVKQLGVADSKVLSEVQRDTLFGLISSHQQLLGWRVEILSPNYISNSMLQISKYNLNALSHDSAIGLIRKVIEDGVKVKEVYVDTVGDPAKYQDKLQRLFPQLKVTVAKKADSLYPIVSAASICAKVVRDACIKHWVFPEQCCTESMSSLGSGYPADPNTKAWLERSLDLVFGYPTIARFGWSTCRDILDSKAVEVQWEDDDENEAAIGCEKISKYFSKTSEPKKRHRYFEDRGLKNFSDF